MRFAPTLPAPMYPILDNGKYHLVQAHHLVDAHEHVIDWFAATGHGSGHVTIVDNGVMEKGEPDVYALRWAIDMIEPSVAICPDAFRSMHATIDLMEEHAVDIAKMVPTVMLVPQGNTLHEWCTCASIMLGYASGKGLHCILGVPKILDTYAGGRWSALAWLEDAWPNVSTHLLGVWNGIYEVEMLLGWFDNIIGIDTTLPYALALNRWTVWDHREAKVHMDDRDWKEPADEVATWIASINIASMRRLLERSVGTVRSTIGRSRPDTVLIQAKQLQLPLGRHRDATKPERDDPS